MKVVLFKVGRNMNRAYRTCEFFGIKTMQTCKCTGSVKGNLFKSKDMVYIEDIAELPEGNNVIYFETDGTSVISDIDWSVVDTIVFGGESNDLPKRKDAKRVVIKKKGNISGLTVEAALAIALYEYDKTNIL